MTDTLAAGEIVEMKGKMIMVEMGSFRFRVSKDKIERISRLSLRRASDLPRYIHNQIRF